MRTGDVVETCVLSIMQMNTADTRLMSEIMQAISQSIKSAVVQMWMTMSGQRRLWLHALTIVIRNSMVLWMDYLFIITHFLRLRMTGISREVRQILQRIFFIRLLREDISWRSSSIVMEL